MHNRIANILTTYKKYFFISIVLIFTGGFIFLSSPKFNGRLDGWNIKDNPQFKALELKDSLFGNSTKIYLQITPNSNDLKQVFKDTKKISDTLVKFYPGINAISPVVFHKKMIRHWNTKNNNLNDFLIEASNTPILTQLIAKDKKSFLVVIDVPNIKEIDVIEFENIIAENKGDSITTHSLSEIHLFKSIEENIKHDIILISILVLILFLGYISFTFKSLYAIFYTLIIVIISIASTIGLFSIFNFSINLISIISIPVVLILSLTDSLHLVTGYNKFQMPLNKNKGIEKTLNHYIIPSFYSSFTTAVAFFSFYLFGDSDYITEFGLIASIALLIEFVLTYSISPFLLYYFNSKKIVDKPIRRISSFLFNYRKVFSYTLVGILIISVFFISEIKVKADSDLFFPKGSKIKAINDDFKKNYHSPIGFNVIIKDNRRHLTQLQQDSLFNYTKTITDTLRNVNEISGVYSATDQYFFKTKLGISLNLFSVLGDRNPYYSSDHNAFLIEVQIINPQQIKYFTTLLTHQNHSNNITINCSSSKLLMDEANHSISISLIKSISTSGIAIFLIILMLTKSIKASLLSLIPNLIPLGFIVLIYYFFNMNLNTITALTMVIGLGLLDDDTVHILYRKLWLKEPLDELNFSILSSAIILSGSFLFFTISSFTPIQVFGWVTALIFIIGVICELTIMRWILEQIKK